MIQFVMFLKLHLFICVYMEVRGHLTRASSLLPLYLSWGLSSGGQVWWQVPFHIEPSSWLQRYSLEGACLLQPGSLFSMNPLLLVLLMAPLCLQLVSAGGSIGGGRVEDIGASEEANMALPDC